MQLAVATEAAAATTPQKAKAAPTDRGRSSGNTSMVPASAISAAARAVLGRLEVAEPRYGSKTTAKTGASEKSATRVESTMSPLSISINPAGTTKKPRPTNRLSPSVLPLGQRTLRTNAAIAAKTANSANGSVSVARDEEPAGDVELGRRSDRREGSAQRRHSSSKAPTGAAFFLNSAKCRPPSSIRTHRRSHAWAGHWRGLRDRR